MLMEKHAVPRDQLTFASDRWWTMKGKTNGLDCLVDLGGAQDPQPVPPHQTDNSVLRTPIFKYSLKTITPRVSQEVETYDQRTQPRVCVAEELISRAQGLR